MAEQINIEPKDDQTLPEVPNIIDAYVAWNSLPYDARQEATAQFYSTKPEVTASHDIDQEAERFLDGGVVAKAPRLKDVVEDVRQHPENYNRALASDSYDILATPNMDLEDPQAPPKEFVLTEGNAILGLDSFLRRAEELFSKQPDTQELAELSRRMQSETGFMSEKALDHAVEVVASAWVMHIQKGEGYIINVWDPNKFRGAGKSEDMVYARVVGRVQDMLKGKDPELSARLRLTPDSWLDTEYAKLVVLDDWSISGKHMNGYVHKAKEAAEENGVKGLADKIEAHLLMSNKDELEKQGYATVKTVYDNGAESAFGISFSGSHSVADFGFSMNINNIVTGLKRLGVPVSNPHLASLSKEYSQDLDYMRSVAELIPDIAAENAEMARLLTVHRALTQDILKTRSVGVKGSDVDEADDRWRRLHDERKAVYGMYDGMRKKRWSDRQAIADSLKN